MNRSSVGEIFLVPIILCIAMVACALVTGRLAGVSASGLYVPYTLASIACTFYALLLTTFCWVVQLARARAEAPLRAVGYRLVARAPLMLLPLLVFPIFLASFTATKSAIPFLVGYSWDPFWAEADRLIFGNDAWRIAHGWLGERAIRPLEFFYYISWGLCLLYVMPLVALNASPKFTGKFFTAMMATWILGGAAMAYLFSAAGPVFAHLVTNSPAEQFGELRAVLNATLRPHGPIETGQRLLPITLHSHVAVKGGGISAMPSMHLGTVSIYVLGARRTRWFVPAIAFWLIIFVCSAYFGFHYWIDGIVAAIVAAACWAIAGRLSFKSEATELGQMPAEAIGAQPLHGI